MKPKRARSMAASTGRSFRLRQDDSGLDPANKTTSRPTPGPVALDHGPTLTGSVRRSAGRRGAAGDRSLPPERQGDTMEAIAPDAAALRSRQCRKSDGLRFVFDVT